MSQTVSTTIINELQGHFPDILTLQETVDAIPTLWITQERVKDVLRYLKNGVGQPYPMLYDLTAIDERMRANRDGQPKSDFTLVYTLLSFDRNAFIRLKVPLEGDYPSTQTIVDIWPSANWYEREVFDLFGITFEGHPFLRRIMMPSTWTGHPLRKDNLGRGTDLGGYIMEQAQEIDEKNAQQFNPDDWGLPRHGEDTDYMFLNMGPQHPGTHGPFRIILALDGEEIIDAVPEVGYHHRAQEKMAERQSWHKYIPYTDRIDYLAGVLNELPYLLSVEKLAGIKIPPRAQVIRVMMAELFRIINHLVFLGTFAQDLGAMSPVFYMFTDREQAFVIVEAVTGARMHPGWFRIGGTAADLPKGWEKLFDDYLKYQEDRMNQYDEMLFKNRIFTGRTKGVGRITREEAIEWGVSGPFMRSTGFNWDWRKAQPYSGYEQFEFEIPVGANGDSFDRAMVHAHEIRQSIRIIRQCIDNMPPGPYKSDHPLATPPVKEYTMQDIETLIDHFLGVSWGPPIPPGEAMVPSEGSKGSYSFYAISDFNTSAYRVHIRSASFPHLQTLPMLSRGLMIPDLLAILGSIDFVMGDVDR